MVPSVSDRRLVAFDDLEKYNSGQLSPAISAKSNSSLADHDTLLIRLNFGVE
jgi:hypothetical protein